MKASVLCSICGSNGVTTNPDDYDSVIDMVTISHDPQFYQDAGLLKPHHAVHMQKYGGTVKAPVCRDCMSKVFSHISTHRPIGVFRSYCLGNDGGPEEKRKLKAFSLFETLLAGTTCDAEDIKELVRLIRDEPLKFSVTLR